MIAFHRAQDWTALWEDFYLSIDQSGRHRYRTIKQFAGAIGKNEAQKKFLRWYLGPALPDEANIADEKYPKVTPLDWMDKRETGGWYTEKNLVEAGKEVRNKFDALASLKESGGLPLRFMQRIEKLAQKLDQAFLGELFVPGRTEAENIARTEGYFRLLDRLLKMEGEAFHLYAKSLGIDFQNMEGFASLLAASASVQSANTQATSRLSQAMEQIVSMALTKSAKYGTKLPPEVNQKLIEVSAQSEPKKKDRLV